MKASWEDEYEMPSEFDFSKLKRVPNPFRQRFQDLHLVALDPDVAAAFSSSEDVNAALRKLISPDQDEVSTLRKAS